MTDASSPGSTAATGLPAATIAGIAAAAGLVPLNSTMIAVALPSIAADFDITTGRAGLLVTVYLIAMLVGQPIAGRVADRIGSRRAVDLALVGMMICSVWAACSPTFTVLAAGRLAQACFAAVLIPGVQSLLREVSHPRETGRTFGLLGSVIGVGAAGGPVVGGVLTQLFGWRAIFVVNIPIAAAAFVMARRLDTDASAPAEPDERQMAEHILNPVFIVSFALQALSTAAQYALLLLTPIILDARGWGPGPTGIALSALTVGMIVVGPLGGRAGDRRGQRGPSVRGLGIATAALVALVVGGEHVDPAILIIALAMFGLGLGFTTPNLMTAALGSVAPRMTGSAAGLLSMSRYVGSIATSVAMSAFVMADASGTRLVLAGATISMTLALLGASRLPTISAAARHPVVR